MPLALMSPLLVTLTAKRSITIIHHYNENTICDLSESRTRFDGTESGLKHRARCKHN